MLVGVDDDSIEWTSHTATVVKVQHALGVRIVRVTLRWSPGSWKLDAKGQMTIRRIGRAVHLGDRVVLEVYGAKSAPPATAERRTEYCSYVVDALQHARSVHDVVIWNEANNPRFWSPQAGAPAAYEALLAQCYDAIHAVRPSVNVVSTTAPRHDPAAFIAGLGAAYRASGRTLPIFDTFGHNAYPDTDGESPFVQHDGAGAPIDEGDYSRLLDALTSAFGGTGQPVPGQGSVRIWYLEDGFQTTVAADKRRLYHGHERDHSLLSPTALGGQKASVEPDQATQLETAIELAYCQPAVGALFNFQLADDPKLSGWQSGVLWPDWTPKPSYAGFRAAVSAVASGQIDCASLPAAATGASDGYTALANTVSTGSARQQGPLNAR